MGLIRELITLYIFVIVASALMSWLPPNVGGAWRTIRNVLFAITEPILAPIRRILPRSRNLPIDFSPWVAIILLEIVSRII
jgi:YggT family protein